jgi:pimeloyl-ACP methyl ester carboxylesterase
MTQYVSTDLINVALRQDGPVDAPVVVLLHGWPDDVTTGDNSHLAAAGYRVITP